MNNKIILITLLFVLFTCFPVYSKIDSILEEIYIFKYLKIYNLFKLK